MAATTLAPASDPVALFDRAVSWRGEAIALTQPGGSYSYRQLQEWSQAFSRWLREETDLRPGDRVAIQLPTLAQYFVVLFGALRAGLVVVNTNPLYTAHELSFQLRDSGARGLISLEGGSAAATAVAECGLSRANIVQTAPAELCPWPLRVVGNMLWRRRSGAARRPADVASLRGILAAHKSDVAPSSAVEMASELMVLQYTGGTTGTPKAAMLSRAAVAANVRQVLKALEHFELAEGSVAALPLPLYHIYAFTVSLASLCAGLHLLLIPDPRDLVGASRALRRHPPQLFYGLNTLFNALCAEPAFRRLDFSRWRHTISGGMPLSPVTAKHWQGVTGSTIYEGYGLTEASPVVSLNLLGYNRPGTVGRPLCDTQLRLLDEGGVERPAGERGEVAVRGPQLMDGYWQREEETVKVLDDEGWLHTGDVGRIDGDGYLSIVDRIKDVILVSGFNVYPREIEEVVAPLPGVIECAAVGVDDAHSGERVRLVVAVDPDSGLDREALVEHCRLQLTGYKLPKEIVMCQSLPKSPVGKVLRAALRTAAWSEQGDADQR